MNYSYTILIGRIGRIDTRKVGEGEDARTVTNIGLAVDRPYTVAGDEDGNKVHPTDWFEVEAWNALGEMIAKYGQVGRLVMVSGRPEIRTRTRTLTIDVPDVGEVEAEVNQPEFRLVAEDFRFLDRKPETKPEAKTKAKSKSNKSKTKVA